MGSSLRLAAIVAVYNEADFLPQFVRYYASQCQKIFILDNESTDGSVRAIQTQWKSPKIEIQGFSTGQRFDTARKQACLMAKKRDCISKFDYVLVLDADEFVVPKKGGLIAESIDGKEDVYATQGWNMYAYPDDPPYDPAKTFFEQRKRGVENRHYSKPIIVRPEYPADYSMGCHYLNGFDIPQVSPPDMALFNLLHYRGFDEAVFVRRSLERTRRIEVTNRVDGPHVGGYYANGDEHTFKSKFDYEKNAGQVTRLVP